MIAVTESDPAPKAIIDKAVKLLRAYLADQRTDTLKDLARLIVDLRASFALDDGRRDWAGRSPGYRQAMADLYSRARVPHDQLDTVQTAMRYHVGNLLRDRATSDELKAVGLTTTSPKARLATAREALAAQREVAAPRQDAARLAAYAQALLEFIDEAAMPDLPSERAIATRIALEAIQRRAEDLLGRLRDARGGARKPRRRPGAL